MRETTCEFDPSDLTEQDEAGLRHTGERSGSGPRGLFKAPGRQPGHPPAFRTLGPSLLGGLAAVLTACSAKEDASLAEAIRPPPGPEPEPEPPTPTPTPPPPPPTMTTTVSTTPMPGNEPRTDVELTPEAIESDRLLDGVLEHLPSQKRYALHVDEDTYVQLRLLEERTVPAAEVQVSGATRAQIEITLGTVEIQAYVSGDSVYFYAEDPGDYEVAIRTSSPFARLEPHFLRTPPDRIPNHLLFRGAALDEDVLTVTFDRPAIETGNRGDYRVTVDGETNVVAALSLSSEGQLLLTLTDPVAQDAVDVFVSYDPIGGDQNLAPFESPSNLLGGQGDTQGTPAFQNYRVDTTTSGIGLRLLQSYVLPNSPNGRDDIAVFQFSENIKIRPDATLQWTLSDNASSARTLRASQVTIQDDELRFGLGLDLAQNQRVVLYPGVTFVEDQNGSTSGQVQENIILSDNDDDEEPFPFASIETTPLASTTPTLDLDESFARNNRVSLTFTSPLAFSGPDTPETLVARQRALEAHFTLIAGSETFQGRHFTLTDTQLHFDVVTPEEGLDGFIPENETVQIRYQDPDLEDDAGLEDTFGNRVETLAADLENRSFDVAPPRTVGLFALSRVSSTDATMTLVLNEPGEVYYGVSEENIYRDVYGAQAIQDEVTRVEAFLSDLRSETPPEFFFWFGRTQTQADTFLVEMPVKNLRTLRLYDAYAVVVDRHGNINYSVFQQTFSSDEPPFAIVAQTSEINHNALSFTITFNDNTRPADWPEADDFFVRVSDARASAFVQTVEITGDPAVPDSIGRIYEIYALAVVTTGNENISDVSFTLSGPAVRDDGMVGNASVDFELISLTNILSAETNLLFAGPVSHFRGHQEDVVMGDRSFLTLFFATGVRDLDPQDFIVLSETEDTGEKAAFILEISSRNALAGEFIILTLNPADAEFDDENLRVQFDPEARFEIDPVQGNLIDPGSREFFLTVDNTPPDFASASVRNTTFAIEDKEETIVINFTDQIDPESIQPEDFFIPPSLIRTSGDTTENLVTFTVLNPNQNQDGISLLISVADGVDNVSYDFRFSGDASIRDDFGNEGSPSTETIATFTVDTALLNMSIVDARFDDNDGVGSVDFIFATISFTDTLENEPTPADFQLLVATEAAADGSNVRDIDLVLTDRTEADTTTQNRIVLTFSLDDFGPDGDVVTFDLTNARPLQDQSGNTTAPNSLNPAPFELDYVDRNPPYVTAINGQSGRVSSQLVTFTVTMDDNTGVDQTSVEAADFVVSNGSISSIGGFAVTPVSNRTVFRVVVDRTRDSSVTEIGLALSPDASFTDTVTPEPNRGVSNRRPDDPDTSDDNPSGMVNTDFVEPALENILGATNGQTLNLTNRSLTFTLVFNEAIDADTFGLGGFNLGTNFEPLQRANLLAQEAGRHLRIELTAMLGVGEGTTDLAFTAGAMVQDIAGNPLSLLERTGVALPKGIEIDTVRPELDVRTNTATAMDVTGDVYSFETVIRFSEEIGTNQLEMDELSIEIVFGAMTFADLDTITGLTLLDNRSYNLTFSLDNGVDPVTSMKPLGDMPSDFIDAVISIQAGAVADEAGNINEPETLTSDLGRVELMSSEGSPPFFEGVLGGLGLEDFI